MVSPAVREPHDERLEVFARRLQEALAAGLDHESAVAFAGSTIDIGELRKLVAAGCEPDLISRILL